MHNFQISIIFWYFFCQRHVPHTTKFLAGWWGSFSPHSSQRNSLKCISRGCLETESKTCRASRIRLRSRWAQTETMVSGCAQFINCHIIATARGSLKDACVPRDGVRNAYKVFKRVTRAAPASPVPLTVRWAAEPPRRRPFGAASPAPWRYRRRTRRLLASLPPSP